MFTLRRLPATSVEHGDVISLLIEHHRGPFGIVDHDCYLFDADLLGHLMPAPDECMVALVADRHPHLNFELPLTHLLVLNAEPLRRLMQETGIDAGMARHTPPAAQAAFTRLIRARTTGSPGSCCQGSGRVDGPHTGGSHLGHTHQTQDGHARAARNRKVRCTAV